MINFSQRKLLKELKEIYDKTLKESYLNQGNGLFDNDFPYSERYPNYFKQFILDKTIKTMRPKVYKAYKEGAGHELDVGKGGTPPKFLSIGSSSRFCFVSLEVNDCTNEKEGAVFFVHNHEKIGEVEFEKVLPIFPDANLIHPHMDAYLESETRQYFFECKCHEMFDDHPIKVSERYFGTGKDLIVDYIDKEYLHKDAKMYNIGPEAFGLKDKSLFDIKQLLTHLMAIKCNKNKKACSLIYYYCVPRKQDIHNELIVEIIDRVKKDAITIFKSKLIKHYCDKNGIELELYFKEFDEYSASSRNTYRVY